MRQYNAEEGFNMALQPPYKLRPDLGFPGQKATTGVIETESYLVSGEGVTAGLGLAHLDKHPVCGLPTETITAESFAGVVEYNIFDKDVLPDGFNAALITYGKVFVTVNGGCARNGKVYWAIKGDQSGQFFGAKDENNVELPNCRFVSATADGEVGTLHIQQVAGV
jgi:hypothetical protein